MSNHEYAKNDGGTRPQICGMVRRYRKHTDSMLPSLVGKSSPPSNVSKVASLRRVACTGSMCEFKPLTPPAAPKPRNNEGAHHIDGTWHTRSPANNLHGLRPILQHRRTSQQEIYEQSDRVRAKHIGKAFLLASTLNRTLNKDTILLLDLPKPRTPATVFVLRTAPSGCRIVGEGCQPTPALPLVPVSLRFTLLYIACNLSYLWRRNNARATTNGEASQFLDLCSK